MLGLITGQTWVNSARSRLILEARGYSVTFCKPSNPDKTWTVTPSEFVKWVSKSDARLVAGPGSKNSE